MTWVWSLGFIQPGKAVKTDGVNDGIGAVLGHHGPTATKPAWSLLRRASRLPISPPIAATDAPRNTPDLVKKWPPNRLS